MKNLIYFSIFAVAITSLVGYSSHDAFAATLNLQVNNTDNTGYSQSRMNNTTFDNVQLPFLENIGQTNNQVKYYANTFAGTVFVTDDSITYSLHTVVQKNNNKGLAIKERFLGGTTLNPQGMQKSPSAVNYFVGDRENWRSNIPAYDTINLGRILPSIDASLKAHGDNIEKILTVHPGGNVDGIKIKFDGIISLQIGNHGELLVNTRLGVMSLTAPAAFQNIDGARMNVPISYTVDGTAYGFSVGKYDHTHDLVIDPLLASTFVGGLDIDFSRAMAVDSSGDVYVTGYTMSSNYPITAGEYDKTYGGGGSDGFISKLDGSLSTLLASTIIGGSGIDYPYAMAIDSSGNVYVAGRTESADYPVTADAYDSTFKGLSKVFISKLDGSLSTLLASTFIGGKSFDSARAMVLDSGGDVYVTGLTNSSNYPVTAGAYDTAYKSYNAYAFVSKLDSSLGHLLASTLIGGKQEQIGYAIALDSGNNVYVAGQTYSSNYQITKGAYDKIYGGNSDGFVSKLDSSLGHLLASTFIGGAGQDIIRAIVVNSTNVYVAGVTNSSNYPVTVGAYDRIYNGAGPVPISGDDGSGDIFVSKLDTSLSTLLASTYIGGNRNDAAFALAINSSNVYVAGYSESQDYPVTSGAYDVTFKGGEGDGVVSKLDTSLSTLLASTFIGGGRDDLIRGMVINSGSVYVTGRTNSENYPVTAGAYDKTLRGNYDVFVSKLDSGLSGTTSKASISLSPAIGPVGKTVTVNGTGFAAGSGMTIKYAGIIQAIPPTTTDATGSFSVVFTVPTSTAGLHPVVATDASANTATAKFHRT